MLVYLMNDHTDGVLELLPFAPYIYACFVNANHEYIIDWITLCLVWIYTYIYVHVYIILGTVHPKKVLKFEICNICFPASS